MQNIHVVSFVSLLWLFGVAGFEKVTPENHLSAVETLRRSKPHSAAQRSKFADDSRLSSAVGASSAQNSPQKCSFPASDDAAMACCTAPRALNGKRRLSSSRRDDSSSGCERQRKYCGSALRKLLPGNPPNDSQPYATCETLSKTNDSAISQYLSFKFEHMDLQSDVQSAEKPPSPKWILPGKCAAANSDTSKERRTHEADIVRSFTKYRHGLQEAHRSGGRRCRRPSSSRAGMPSRDANYLARHKDDKRLETFFSQMGMDTRTWSATVSGSPELSAFENVSSIDTSTLESRTSYAESERVGDAVLDSFDVNERDTGVSSSIVERNARIIKWLCSIRKASAGDDVQFDDGFV